MIESIYFQDDKILVSQTRYIVSGTTYAIRNISSVAINNIEKSRFFPLFLLIVGLIAFLATLAVGDRGTEMWIPIGLVLIVIGGAWLATIKDEYSVRITTNAGQRDSYISTNRELITNIVHALNEAIIGKEKE